MRGENGIPETPDWIPEQREAPEWIRPEVKPARQLCKQWLDGRGEQ